MRAMLDFMKTLLRMPAGWRVWLGLLMLVNGVVPLFFLPRIEALVVIAAMMLGAMIQAAIHSRLGFVRLLGIGHLPWIPMVGWLLGRFDPFAPQGVFGAWLLAVILLDSLSLLIDVVDVVRFARGEREPQLTSQPQ